MRRLCQWINLVHELAELAAPKKVANDCRERLGIHQLGGCHGIRFLVKKRHALLHQALGTGQAHPALVGEQFTHGANTTATKVIYIVQYTLAHLELQQVTRCLSEILLGEHATFIGILNPQFLLDLVAPHPAKVIALGIEEKTL